MKIRLKRDVNSVGLDGDYRTTNFTRTDVNDSFERTSLCIQVVCSLRGDAPAELDARIELEPFKGSKKALIRPSYSLAEYSLDDGKTWDDLYQNAYAAIKVIGGRDYQGPIYFTFRKVNS